MAGDWIKLQHVTPDKPEIYQLASELKATPEDALGRCLRLWIWADQQSLNGHALTVTLVTLDAVARRDGFGTALLKTGWVKQNDDGTITLPNFDRHNGETAKTRSLASDRKKKQRNVIEKCHADVTEMSRSNSDKNVTREEKRREEKLTTTVSHEKIVFDGRSFQNVNGQLAIWQKAYPALDIQIELNKAAAWIAANPKNAKSNYARFLTNWLSRAQDKAPKVAQSSPKFRGE